MVFADAIFGLTLEQVFGIIVVIILVFLVIGWVRGRT